MAKGKIPKILGFAVIIATLIVIICAILSD